MAYRSKPVVIDGEVTIDDDGDDDAKRVMAPERQEAFVDALTELCRQWGIRLRNWQSAELTALEKGLRPDGKYTLRHGKVQWTGPKGERLE